MTDTCRVKVTDKQLLQSANQVHAGVCTDSCNNIQLHEAIDCKIKNRNVGMHLVCLLPGLLNSIACDVAPMNSRCQL